MTTYIYEPLDHGKAQTRVVHLIPAIDSSEPIRISLHKVTIPRSCLQTPLESDFGALNLASEESDVEEPHFVALSYVWGSPDNPKEVIVESAPEGANKISITRNLDEALRAMRPESGVAPVWIDAICIDQGNLEERSYQVAFMDTIYTVAARTFVWLGPEEDDSNDALQILVYVGRRVEYTSDGNIERHPDAPPREPDDPILESQNYKDIGFSENDLRTVITFFERPWFTRLWVRQEIALASEVRILCGKGNIDWTHLQNAAGWFCQTPFGPSVPVELEERRARIRPAVRSLCLVNMHRLSYENLRDRNAGVRFTDPRDSIYAVKSLLLTRDQELDVRPNYTLQTAEVFEDVCVRILERQGLTYFLQSCDLNSISVPGLPSWVPDWSKPTTVSHDLLTPWSACGFISANAKYLGDGVLRVAGIPTNRIESVRDLHHPVDDGIIKYPAITFDYIWRCYPGDSFIDSPYDETQSMTDAYCRTFHGGLFPENWHSSSYSHHLQPFDEAKEALKRIWAVEKDWTGYEDLKKDPLVKEFLYRCSHWIFGRCFFITEDGYIGLAPLGTEPGDIISVILGCHFPVVLRKDPESSVKSGETRWKVVGICYINGMMYGEAIYGSLPSHYRPVIHDSAAEDERICDTGYALLDKRTNHLKSDPAALLEELGIQPSVWSRSPHRLEVSESVSREAGVGLHNFFLV